MKILIADDELVSRKKLEKLIQSLGYETIAVEDGNDAWEIWNTERTKMVITDWVMPGINGLDLCKKIRKFEGSQYTYIIMVTAKTNVHDIVTGIEAGADDFIPKPFVKEELLVRIMAGERILGFQTRDIVIFSMAKLAESRDPETGNHLERIRYYSKALAEALAQTGEHREVIDSLFIDNIFRTSPLHDVGKIGTPDYILLKPGRLNDREFEIMKNHCRIGFETLNEALKRYPKADYLKMSAEIALSHHEKFDGTGYPNGLEGDQIPIAARIVALADVYDALVSKRVYKEAFMHDLAKTLILEESGTHFDPMVVDAFLASEKSFIKIFKRFKDS
ncbi:MAG: response regulator [Desulfobacterales bacterium]|nr:response regulator [Desulfobacterales bacterium]